MLLFFQPNVLRNLVKYENNYKSLFELRIQKFFETQEDNLLWLQLSY